MLLLGAPRGGKRLGYLPSLWVLLCCVMGLLGHGGSNIKEGDHCVPWLCSCFYRGVYYDVGDIWPDVNDPCTVFQCKDNGYFEAVKSGCSFKGECKDRGSTWYEGCIRYTCPEDRHLHGYRLQQAACVWKDGNCYAVGERATEHCDIYECQLDHGCYVMNLIKSGCKVTRPDSVRAECKPLYSFWQDECSMYQCVGEEKDELKARVLIHSHDVMSWPRGHYALLEPTAKCPDLEKGIWMEGWYSHCGDGCNFKSQPFDLLGSYNKTMFQHQFCVHHDVDDPELIPLYQTYWEPGRYCILRYNGTCPKDFREGYLEMTNSQCLTSEMREQLQKAGLDMSGFNMSELNITGINMTDFNITDGRLPDGNFTVEKTRIEFCCRYDGEIERAIILPAKHPFVLFMAKNETECQSVQGMRVEKEFWSFCDTEDGRLREMNGSLPLIKTGDNNTLVNFCYYSPLGCGCTDDEDNMLAIGENKTDECVTTQCRNIEDHNVMVVIEGGCWDELHERCWAENATWDDTRGEMCLVRQCVRITQPEDQLNVTFKIIDIEKGCRDGAECRPLNYTKEKGCYASQCKLDVMGDASFVLIRAGCAVGKDVCIPDKANHTVGCITVGCDRTKSSCGLHVIKAGCRDLKGECIDVDSAVTQHCTDWTCRELKKDGKLSWKLVPDSHGCADRSGKCYEEGDTVNSGCVTYECIYGDRPGFYPTLTLDGCSYKGKCYKEGENVTLGAKCITYKCSKEKKMIVVSAGCNYKDKCYPGNENFTDGCTTFMCHYNGTNVWRSFVQKACKVDGKCIDPGTVYKRGCSTMKCSEDKKSCHSIILERGCSFQGKCYKPEENTTVGNCIVYKCFDTGVMKLVKKGCYNKGTCYPVNQNYTIGCTTFMCNFNGTNLWSSFLQKACKVDGKCIDPGTVYKRGCSTMKCSDDKKSCHSIILERGCSFQGKCYKPEENTTVGNCIVYKCFDTGVMKLVKKGCYNNGTCYPVNQNYTIGCTTFMCNFNGTNLWSSFLQKACKVDGKCIDPGTVYKRGCSTMKCSEDKKSCHSIILERGCSFQGKCYKPEENTTIGNCIVYKCFDTGVMKLVKKGCYNNGTCYPVNQNYTIGCTTFMCNFNGTNLWSSFLQKACKVDGKCIDPGTVYKRGCSTMKCSEDKKSCHSIILERGCSLHGKCYKVGETAEVPANCVTYKCFITGAMKVVSAGCNVEGTCHPANDKYTIDCKSYICNFNGTHVWPKHIQTGCTEDGKCIPVGTQRLSMAHSHYCKTQQCHHGTFQTIKNQCKAADGTCIDMTAEGTTYNLIHSGKPCTGFCYSKGIKDIKC